MKLAEISGHPEEALLLEDHFEKNCKIDLKEERAWISKLFDFPYFGKAKHAVTLREPVCDYILAHYRMEKAPGTQDFGYGLWVREPGA